MNHIALAVLALISLMGQEASTPAAVAVPQQNLLDYQVGASDILSIHVSGVKQFDETVQVSNSGRIHVPYVGVMLVAGLTPLQIEREITDDLKRLDLINEPSVSVAVDQYKAWPTYIVGEVSTPGQFVLSGDMYVLDLISRAGNLTPFADSVALLYRRNPVRSVNVDVRINPSSAAGDVARLPIPPGDPQVLELPLPAETDVDQIVRIDLDALREGTNPDMNVKLQGGDVLYLPRREQAHVFVIGDVKNPGAYALPRRGDVTNKTCRILSGGEKARLVLARILYERPNFLVLDEPTNHLDIATKDMIVRALGDFDGTMLFVSHDRQFLARLSNRVLELTPEGPIPYGGGYVEYVARSGHEAPGLHV